VFSADCGWIAFSRGRSDSGWRSHLFSRGRILPKMDRSRRRDDLALFQGSEWSNFIAPFDVSKQQKWRFHTFLRNPVCRFPEIIKIAAMFKNNHIQSPSNRCGLGVLRLKSEAITLGDPYFGPPFSRNQAPQTTK